MFHPKTLKRLLLLTFMLFAAWVSGQHLIKDMLPQQYHNYTGEVITVDAAKVKSFVKATVKYQRLLIVFIYRTDCAACRVMLQEINDIKYEFPRDEIFVLALSFDDSPEDLVEHLNTIERPLSFRPVFIPEEERSALVTVFAQENSTFSGRVPYIGFLDITGYFTEIAPAAFQSGRIISTIRSLWDLHYR